MIASERINCFIFYQIKSIVLNELIILIENKNQLNQLNLESISIT